MKIWGEVEGFVTPVRQISTARARAHSLLIHKDYELIISADVHAKMLRNFAELKNLLKMQHRLISRGRQCGSNPLRTPRLSLGDISLRRSGDHDAHCEDGDRDGRRFSHRAPNLIPNATMTRVHFDRHVAVTEHSIGRPRHHRA